MWCLYLQYGSVKTGLCVQYTIVFSNEQPRDVSVRTFFIFKFPHGVQQGAVFVVRPDLIDYEMRTQFDIVIEAYDLVSPFSQRRQVSLCSFLLRDMYYGDVTFFYLHTIISFSQS